MHSESALLTKLGEAQVEQTWAVEVPREVVWIPRGRSQVALHWLMEPFTM
jgi:hypothetical protein